MLESYERRKGDMAEQLVVATGKSTVNDSHMLVTISNISTGVHVGPIGALSLFVILFFVFIILTTVAGNALVIAAVLSEKALRRNHYYLIMSLAMADEMVGLLVTPLAAYYDVNQKWTIGLRMCEVWNFFDVLACTASILHLVAIALDRYWSVAHIAYIQHRTKRRIFTMIAVVWGVALLISVPPIFGLKDPLFTERVDRFKVCLMSQDLIYQLFSTILAFYVPLLLILLLYWRIYVVAHNRILRERKRKSYSISADGQPSWQTESCLLESSTNKPEEGSYALTSVNDKNTQTIPLRKYTSLSLQEAASRKVQLVFRRVHSLTYMLDLKKRRSRREELEKKTSVCSVATTSGGSASVALPKREIRAARTLAIVTGSFILCWLPFFVLALYRPIACSSSLENNISTSNYCNIPPLLDSVFLWLGYVNSALNPLIYTVFSPDFAKAFKKILTKTLLRSR
ncbi:serotonin receptor protein [Trichuris trichiura]|uniref:Serotonin receptor protein n=1 Tax=Trichuris trichiura TaxID=36087 RepID=A0A077Z3U5_TRITR|nr:serotonin receptor protein [Trichuris trichiura]